MSQLLVFENPGEIDPRSISTFGVSVKEGSNPIGFFGTGLKYAIAVLLRTGHKVTILAGLRVIRFALDSQIIRGKTFDLVTMSIDGAVPVSMGFSTELGKKWEVWMAYRELSCNCRDEAGTEGFADYCPDAVEGMTKLIVDGELLAKAYESRHQFILQDQPSFVVDNVEVRRRSGSGFYYRGVKVHNFSSPTLFTYNNLSFMELTEDRTLKYQFEAEGAVRSALLACDNEEVLRSCLTADRRTLEGGLDFHGWGIPAGPTFLKIVGECIQDDPVKVNQTAVVLFKEATKRAFDPVELALTHVQQMSVESALDFCERIGFQIRGAYPIRYAESLGDGILGLAHEGTIFISERCFQVGGAKQLAATFIEEYLHLRHKWLDCSREMQNFLFEKLVSVGEELVGEPL